MNLIVQKMVTWIFTKCLLWTKQFLSRQHSHLASMLYCCCWFSWVLFCWPQTIYWSLLRKPLPDLKQRKNSCNPNDCSFLFLFLLLFFLERTVLGECVYFVFRVCFVFFLLCTNYHRPGGHELEQALEVGDGQGSLVCCSPWGRKELDTTATELSYYSEVPSMTQKNSTTTKSSRK